MRLWRTVLRLSLLFIIASTLIGCGGIRGERKTEVIHYDTNIKLSLSPRKKPAQELDQKPGDGYVRLGTLEVQHIYKTCFPLEKGRQHKCYEKKHDQDSATHLRALAANKGADAVVFSRRNAQDTGGSSTQGKCLTWDTRYVTKNVCHSICTSYGKYGCKSTSQRCRSVQDKEHYCTSYEKIYGTKYSQVSSAEIWRYDLQMAAQLRYGDLMFKAIASGKLPEVKRLIAKGVPANQPDLTGRMPLTEAVRAKQYAVAQVLMAQGADPNADQGRALEFAARQCERSMLETMHAKGARFEPVSAGIIEGALRGQCKPDILAYVLDKGAKPKKAEEALTLAVTQADPSALRLLVAHGARATKEALIEAGVATRPEHVGLLLKAGVSPNPWHAQKKWYLLTYLVQNMSRHDSPEKTRQKVAIIRALLEAGANPDKKGFYQHTALAWGSAYGHVEAVELLLKHGASTRTKPPFKGETILGMVERHISENTTTFTTIERLKKVRQLLIAAGAKR